MPAVNDQGKPVGLKQKVKAPPRKNKPAPMASERVLGSRRETNQPLTTFTGRTNHDRAVAVRHDRKAIKKLAKVDPQAALRAAAQARVEHQMRRDQPVMRPTQRPTTFLDPITPHATRVAAHNQADQERQRKQIIKQAVINLNTRGYGHLPTQYNRGADVLRALGTLPGHSELRAALHAYEPKRTTPRLKLAGVLDNVRLHTDNPNRAQQLALQSSRFTTDHSYFTKALGGAAMAVGSLFQNSPNQLSFERAAMKQGGPGSVSALLSAQDALNASVHKGLGAAESVTGQAFDRGVGAVESKVAHTALDLGLVNGALARKIRRSRGWQDVLLKGRDWKTDTTGGDLARIVHLPKQLGLIPDIALDPLMYIGVGLAPETGGASVLPLLAKIQRLAPELFADEKFIKAAAEFQAGGHAKTYAKHLRGLVKDAEDENLAAHRAALQSSLAGKETHATTIHLKGGKSVTIHIPAESADAVATAADRAAMNTHAPQLRLRFGNPMNPNGPKGRSGEWFGATIPIDLSGSRLFGGVERMKGAGTVMLRKKKAVEDAIRVRMSAEREAVYAQIDAAILRAGKDQDKIRALRKERADADKMFAAKTREALQEAEASGAHRITLQDMVDYHNSIKVQHAAYQAASNFQRTVQARYSEALAAALRDLGGSAAERVQSKQRVQLYLQLDAAAKGTTRGLLDEAIRLTPDEHRVADNLKAFYDSMLQHGIKAGIMDRGIEDYVGTQVWKHLDDPQSFASALAGSSRAFQQHRKIGAITEFASRNELAAKIHELGGVLDFNDSMRLADELWHRGITRTHGELEARRLIRTGEPKLFEDFTPSERGSFNRLAGQGLDPAADSHQVALPEGVVTRADKALLHTPESHPTTGGYVLPGDFAHHGMDLEGLRNLPEPERIATQGLSILEDMQRVAQMIKDAPAGSIRDDLQTILGRLEEELSGGIIGEPIHMDVAAVFHAGPAREATVKIARERISSLMEELRALEPIKQHHIEELAKTKALLDHPNATIKDKELIAQHIAQRKAALDDIEGQQMRISDQIDHFDAQLMDNTKVSKSALEGDLQTAHIGAPAEDLTSIQNRLAAEKLAADEAAIRAHPQFRPFDPNGGKADKLLGKRAEHQDVIEKLNELGIRKLDELSPKDVAFVLGKDKELWIKGPEWEGAPPSISVPRGFEAGPNTNPFDRGDLTGHIRDFRASADTGAMTELDPAVLGSKRIRGQATMTALAGRWMGVDRSIGRSTKEFDDLTVKLGEEDVPISQLIPHSNAEGVIDGFYKRGSTELIPAKDIKLPPKTLIPNKDRSLWVDATTGQPYTRVHAAFADDPNIAMIHTVGADRLWPTQAVDDWIHTSKKYGEYDQYYKSTMDSGVQRTMSMIRFGVTVPFPAYHIRNLISDMLKSLQADTGVMFHPIMNARFVAAAFGKGKSKMLEVPGMEKMAIEDFLYMADLMGVRTGHHMAEFMTMVKDSHQIDVADHGAFRNWFTPKWRKYSPTHMGGWTSKLGANREDIVRFQTFYQRMRVNKGDAADAAWYTIRHHFDYNDLTAWERRTVRNLFLFYTWYRKNIPLQLVELVRRPGFFAGISHIYNGLANGTTPVNFIPAMNGAIKDMSTTPDYLKDTLGAAAVNWNGHALSLGFGAPWADLAQIGTDQIDQLALANLAPWIGVPLQGITRMDPLTKRTYKENEASGASAFIDAVYHAVTGQHLHKNADGQPTLPWWATIFARNIPVFGRGTASFQPPGPGRDQGLLQKYGSLLAPVTGVNVFVAPKPGTERATFAQKQWVKGRAGQRKQLLTNLAGEGGLSNDYYKSRVAKFDAETLKLASKKGIPKSVIQQVTNSGFHVPKPSGSESGGLKGTGLKGLGKTGL